MRTHKSQVASSTPFDNSTNGFAADDTQTAIEEARSSAVGSLIGYPFISSGNTANKWLGFAINNGSSDILPFIVPQPADLKGIKFMNADNNVDIDIQVFKNGSLFYTELIRNKRWFLRAGLAGSYSFSQGDRLSVYLKRYTGGSGDSTAQDPLVTIILKNTAEQPAVMGAQTGV